MPEARPLPVLRPGDEPAGYRVAMNVTQLLGLLCAHAYIEVVIADLPEGFWQGLFRDGGFKGLNRARESSALGLGHEHVDVLRHDDIAEDMKDITPSRFLETPLEEVARRPVAEVWTVAVATEGQVMEITTELVTPEI